MQAGNMTVSVGSPIALRTESVSRRYRGGNVDVTVFEALSLSLERGERVALTGESGTGKSTLLHMLGLLDAPDAGRIYLGGTDVTSLDEGALAAVRNREIGFVWQMNTLLPEFTALENVMMPLLIRGVGADEARVEARGRLVETGLEARGSHRAGELSGGEQQRVVLARALVTKPKILLADEPTGNLDERSGLMIMELIERVHADNQLTTLYVTHNPVFAARATRILELRGGRLLERGK
jgi:lipoprotein-releasing system ATP-binding protein